MGEARNIFTCKNISKNLDGLKIKTFLILKLEIICHNYNSLPILWFNFPKSICKQIKFPIVFDMG